MNVSIAVGTEGILIAFFIYYMFSIKTTATAGFRKMYQFIQHFLLDYAVEGDVIESEVKKFGEQFVD